MKKSALLLFAMLFALIIFSLAPPRAHAGGSFYTIGTGAVTGVYYPVGKAMAKLVNAKRSQYKMRLTVESTGGSVFNINAVMGGDLDFGVVQSDAQYQAWRGVGQFAKAGPQKKLRSMFSLHSETFFLAAAQGSGVKSYPDLKGKDVAVGNPGSGTRQNLVDILAAYGMSFKDLRRAEGIKAVESTKLLQDGRIQAFAYTVGNPAGLIKEAVNGRIKVRFLAVGPKQLDALTAKYPYYVGAEIPVEFYPGALNKSNVPTLAVKGTFITSADAPEQAVYDITKEVFSNLDQLRKLHPALSRLKKQDMLKGLSAPLHPGAARYYREVGLLK